MFKNYFVTAIRNLQRNKAYSLINILGLSFGLGSAMLIILYVKDELSYDRFQQKKDSIYRVTARMLDEKGNELFKTGKTGLIHGSSFKEDIPEINQFVRVSKNDCVVRAGGRLFNQSVMFADDNFFNVFSFPLVSGDPQKVLSHIQSIVISDESAKKYFGATDAVGKTIELQEGGKFEPFIVSGVARRSPKNSTIKFDMVVPMKYEEKINPDDHWLNFFISTFLVMNPKADVAAVLSKMNQVYNEKAKSQLKEAKEKFNFKGSVTWGLQPLLQIHLSTDYDAEDELSDASNPTYSYILTGIAILILLIACINFINLTIARSLKRSKEIGIRKVVGGGRSQLIRQFMGESFIVCLLSFALAIILAGAALPEFSELANKQLSLSYLADTQLVLVFIGLFLVTGFAAGFYPALVLSGFNPIQTLYNRVMLTAKNYLSRGLVVLQFTLAALLIISTFFIYDQFHYLMHADLGFNDKNVVQVNLDRNEGKRLSPILKTELSKNASVLLVSTHNVGRVGTVARVDGKETGFDMDQIDDNYLRVLEIPIIKGRNFSADYPSDSTSSALVNETFVREAGWKNPIGKTIDLFWRNRKLTVIGVVKDYHFRPLNEKIGSQVFTKEPEGDYAQLTIKISPNDVPETMQFIGKTYKRLVPFYPFDYEFNHDIIAQAYAPVDKWKQIISFASALTIFISCIGLLGLTMLSAEQRVKEIGIRKVLGASVANIVQLVSGNFLKLVLLANLIALPIAWWAVNQWLLNFAYHIAVSWWVFAAAVFITLLIALFTIGFNAFQAALANPVKSLRSE